MYIYITLIFDLTLTVGERQMNVPFHVGDLVGCMGTIGMSFLNDSDCCFNQCEGYLEFNAEHILLHRTNVISAVYRKI